MKVVKVADLELGVHHNMFTNIYLLHSSLKSMSTFLSRPEQNNYTLKYEK